MFVTKKNKYKFHVRGKCHSSGYVGVGEGGGGYEEN